MLRAFSGGTCSLFLGLWLWIFGNQLDHCRIDGFADSRDAVGIRENFGRAETARVGNGHQVPGQGEGAIGGGGGSSGQFGFRSQIGQQGESFVILQTLADLFEADGAGRAVHAHRLAGIGRKPSPLG